MHLCCSTSSAVFHSATVFVNKTANYVRLGTCEMESVSLLLQQQKTPGVSARGFNYLFARFNMSNTSGIQQGGEHAQER